VIIAAGYGYFADHALDTVLGNREAKKQRSKGSPAQAAPAGGVRHGETTVLLRERLDEIRKAGN
jgi:hypothetical protein